MTTLTYANNTIMAYIGADADVVGVTSSIGCPYWAGDKVYFFQTANLIGPGLRQFNIDPDGSETLQRSKASIGVTQISATTGGAAALTLDGTKLHFVSNPGNSAELAQVRASDLTLLGTFGTSGNSTSPSTTTRILLPWMMLARSTDIVCAAQQSDHELDSVLTSGFGPNTNLGNTAEAASTFGTLIGGYNGTNAYVISLPFANGTAGSGHTTPIGVYKIVGTTLSSIGTVSATQIDGTWTRIFTVAGVAYDQSDGHIIIGVQTDEGVGTPTYIIKINTTTAAVMWKRAINVLTPYSWSFTNSRINGKYHYLDGSSLARHINTADGSQTTETVTGLTISGPQFSDSTTNSIIMYGTFIAGGSPPNYVGAVMGTGGNHNVTSWLRFWFATAGGGGGGDGGNRGGLTLSKKRAWTYTQDGHTFYVLDLATEGTWIYDLTTKQWSQFNTQGFGQWDVQAGTQWNKIRVVGGDLSTTDMWEVTPALKQDHDGALDISHTVTGGVQTRSRVFNSVEAVRLSGSTGTIGATTSAVMNLRFSDDNGKTWSAMYPITVTAGVEGEVEWRSLGAFDAPGRIFEISDTGGMVRIDGCDAFIENFDDDSPQQGG